MKDVIQKKIENLLKLENSKPANYLFFFILSNDAYIPGHDGSATKISNINHFFGTWQFFESAFLYTVSCFSSFVFVHSTSPTDREKKTRHSNASPRGGLGQSQSGDFEYYRTHNYLQDLD